MEICDKKNLRSFALECRIAITKALDKNNNKLFYNKIITYTFLYYIFTKHMLVNNYLDNIYVINNIYPNIFKHKYLDKFDELDNIYNKYSINNIIKNVESLSWLYQYFNTELKDEAFEMLKNNQKISSDKVSFATQVFTPKWVTKYLVNSSLGNLLGMDDLEYKLNNNTLVNNVDITNIKVIDPCMGTGLILLHAFDVLLDKYVKLGFSLEEASRLILTKNIYGLEIDEGAYTVAYFSLLMKYKKYNIDINLLNIKLNIFLIDNNNLGSLIKTTSDKSLSKIVNDKYDVVITNPPYMGKKSLNKDLANYIDKNYELGKSELYSAFIVRCLELCKDNGYVSMITIHSWMFIKSFSALRNHIIDNYYMESMVHSGAGTFDDLNSFNALATAFVIRKTKLNLETIYVRLADCYDPYKKQIEFYNKDKYYYVNNQIFKEIPNSPFVYFITDKEYKLFSNNERIKNRFPIKQGLATGDNKRFVRYWYEVDKDKIKFDAKDTKDALNSGYKWFPYNKGGKFCKWYGSNEYVISFDKESFDTLSQTGNKLPSRGYYFKEGITWSLFGFENFGVRYKSNGFVFDVSGSSMFPDEKYIYYMLSFLCSNVCFKLLSLIAPTVNFQVGNIGDLPLIIDESYLEEINKLAIENINICKEVWDNQEVSWDFTINPLLKYNDKVSNSLDNMYELYNKNQEKLYTKLKTNEERLNEIFIKIYNLEGVVSKEVVDRDLTVKKLNKEKVIKDFISYLIGCIMGRFNLNDYKAKPVIEITKIKGEIKYILKLILNKDNVDSDLEYLNSYVNLDKYFNREFMEEHMKMYQKVPMYLNITDKKTRYIMCIKKANETLKVLGIKPIKDFNLDDGIITNIDKILKVIK